MRIVGHALALLTCAGLAWVAAGLWVSSWPTPIPADIQALGIEYYDVDFERQIYIWLGVFSLLCFLWFFWALKAKHD